MDDMIQPNKMDKIEPKPKTKTPEEIKKEKFEAISNDIAKKDTEIEELVKEKGIFTKKSIDIIEKLNSEIINSDNLVEGDTNKLSKETRDAKIKEVEEKTTNLAKKLEEKTDAIRSIRNDRGDLNNQINYINGTRFQYSDNIDEKKSKVSVSLYAIIQRDGQIFEDTEIAVSKSERYKKGATDTTSLVAIKQRLKEQLIADNTALIFKDYNVWISEAEVEERPNIEKGEALRPKYLISEAVERKKETKDGKPGESVQNPDGSYTYTLLDTQKYGPNNPFGTTSKKGQVTYVEQVNMSTIPLNTVKTTKKDLITPNNNKFESRGGTVEPTGSSVVTNQVNNNNKSSLATQENNLTTTAAMYSNLEKIFILQDIKSQTNFEKQLTSNKKLNSYDKTAINQEIKDIKTRISESIKSYNSKNEVKIDETEIRKSATDSAVASFKGINTDLDKSNSANSTINNSNNSYIKVESGSDLDLDNTPSTKELLDPNKESKYLDRNANASTISNENIKPTEINESQKISDGVAEVITKEETDVAEIEGSQAEYNNLLNTRSLYNQPEIPKSSGGIPEVNKKEQLVASTGKKILFDRTAVDAAKLQEINNKTNNKLETINKSIVTQSGQPVGQGGSNSSSSIQNVNNNMQQLTGMTPQLAGAPQEEKTEAIDYSQLLAQMTNLSIINSAIYEVLSSKLKVTIVS